MNNQPQKKSYARAGGVFIALGLLVGAVAGLAAGQSSMGMVIGLGVGATIAIILWLGDRKRNAGE
jgi:UDP-N-acetylmuramyl pentapeptide phosphotransferase/UDP-N-acetylglucosamine-1-phosphate transferase